MTYQATISIINYNETINTICLKNGGDLAHAGLILYKYYATNKRAYQLTSQGSMLCIGKNLTPDKKLKHIIDNPQTDTCFFYHRDGGATSFYKSSSPDESTYFKENTKEFNYLFKDNCWYVKCGNNPQIYELETLLELKGLINNTPVKQCTNPKIKEVSELNNLKKIIIESEGIEYSLIHYRDDAGEHHIFYENETITKEFLSLLKNNESENKQ